MADNNRLSDQALLDHLSQFTTKSVARRLVIQTLDLTEKELQQLLARLAERKVPRDQL